MSVIGLILPNYTMSGTIGQMSLTLMLFAVGAMLALYGAFLVMQTIRHREYFVAVAERLKTTNRTPPLCKIAP